VLNPEKEFVFDLSLNEEKYDNLWMKYTINENCVDISEMSPDRKSLILYSDTMQLTKMLTSISCIITGAENWELEHPKLYDLQIQLYRKTVPRPTDKDEHRKASDITEDDVIIDVKTVRFGFRSCEFRADGFYLNNKKIKLIGLNRHQSFPYVGYAMPKRMQRRDAEILKNELHVNIVRTSHYPQSKHFINRCDELGLLVFTEIPGWQHIGNEEWKRIACDDVKEMVMQYRNHPSVILWGVRINESQDDDELYRKTNAIAHELDPSRQTGGVRYLKKSSLLEDVFTYNDFIHNGQTKGLDRKEEVSPNDKAPYLVTEFNGHMFPTKSFDDEEHRLNHALRHACVLDASFEQEEIAGAIGWCMFDYNTHKDFGSGDRICYHGVMDMFRNPKPAAAVYATQLNEKQVVCEVTSTMDIGEHPAGNIGDIYVFTNSDSVKLYKNDTFIKEFHPSSTMYHHLPHPPFIIDDFVGNLLEVNEHYSHKTAEGLKDILYAVRRYGQNNLPLKYKLKMAYLMLKEHINLEEGTRLYNQYIGNWGNATTTFRFEAIKDQKVGKVIEKIPVSKPTLIAIPDTTELMEEETYDVSAVRITAVDECGNRLAYYQEPIKLKAFGAVELIGPDIVSLKGGACGTFVKTNGTKGEGLLMIEQEESEEITIRFNVS
ncbi:MAG TPA: glycoside hydrolase family 2 TIM barrel-domain containing protein, partial [Mobilitalea sp.]|nr:glycoside hydrolase family 2 TIM barrel-domain containing protein [Mobilitalea sp.]